MLSLSSSFQMRCNSSFLQRFMWWGWSGASINMHSSWAFHPPWCVHKSWSSMESKACAPCKKIKRKLSIGKLNFRIRKNLSRLEILPWKKPKKFRLRGENLSAEKPNLRQGKSSSCWSEFAERKEGLITPQLEWNFCLYLPSCSCSTWKQRRRRQR